MTRRRGGLALALVAALAVTGASLAARAATDHPTPSPAPSTRATSARTTAPLTTAPPTRRTAAAVPDRLRAFRGLGAWVDTYDLGSVSPTRAIPDMRRHGVRTLYLSTGRSDSAQDLDDPTTLAAWLDTAHAAGIRVVGWYVPYYADVAKDERRTLAAARFRTAHGQHFDALGLDIEYPQVVRSPASWGAAVARQLAAVDAATSLPIGAIVLPPQLMTGWPTTRWTAFPWSALRHHADAVLVMAYWTSHTPATRCPHDRSYCVTPYTTAAVGQAHRLTGLPVHLIGGVGDKATASDTAAFARAAARTDAIGVSFYDYATTTPGQWAALRTSR